VTNITLGAMNERNANFWAKEGLRTQMRASDPAIVENALELMNLFRQVGFSVNQIPSFDHFLYAAERSNKKSLANFARKGGKAPKQDALQELIEDTLRQNRNISLAQLIETLDGDAGAGVVTSIDKPSDLLLECDRRYIHYIDNDGRPKTASLTGLKDRLSRAKRKIKYSQ
jgi:hypothetical protein